MIVVCSCVDKGVHGGNMAAVDPSESPKILNPPADKEVTCGDNTETEESECTLNQKDETSASKTTESPDEVQRTSPGNDGGCTASHSEVSVESGTGADQTTCNSPENPPTVGENTEAPGSNQRAFDWSEPEDSNEEAPKQKQENDLNTKTEGAEVQHGSHVDQDDDDDDDEATDDAEEICDEDKISQPDAKHKEKQLETDELVGENDGLEDTAEEEEEAHKGEGADTKVRPKRCRLVCKECGKRFTRRETYNLHRHFHAHEDELTPLTCKECGLSFQHRSSLIKHRNEHREKEEQLLIPKKEVQPVELGSFECAECERVFSTVSKLRDHNCCSTVEKPYHCPLCRQDFQYKVSVTKHMMTHSQESNFTCQECSQTFSNATALRFHQRCHTALKPYECPECGMVFKHYSVMEDHRRRHTDNTRSHLCNICGKSFKYSSLLHQHQYLHTGQKPFHCPECGKTFAFAQNMKAHCRQHRRQETNLSNEETSKQAPSPPREVFRGLGKENAHQTEEPKRSFNCPLCPQTYSVPANLRAHMLVHEAEYEKLERTPRPPTEVNKIWDKGLTCPHCPGVFQDESTLNLHLVSLHKSVAHYTEEVPTPPKKQFIPVSSGSVQGKLKNEAVKSYKCSECAKTFRHRSVLELHMRIHSKDKPYQCKVCGKGFRFSSYLQQHLIIHTGKKPYKCPDCGKDFAFMQNMKTHQRLHQEKPFRCTNCRKGYSDETQLQQHMLSHNGDKPHKCHQCDKSFGLAYLLRDHMNTHTGERPHHCNECNKSFSWFSSLLVHQKIHARKRQGFNQYNSLPAVAKIRGRGRRGGRPWGWSRQLGGSGMVRDNQPNPYPVSTLRDAELQRRVAQTQSSVLSSRMDLQSRQHKEPWLPDLHPQPVQWKVDGGEVMPVPSSQQQTQFESPPHPGLQHHQRSPGWADSPLSTQAVSTSAQGLESSHMKDSPASVIGSFLAAGPQKSSQSAVSEVEQHKQPKPVTWSSPPTSTMLASTSSLQHDFSIPSYIDGAALWSIRPTISVNSQSSSNKLNQELQLPRWASAPVSTQKELPTPKKEDSRVWDLSDAQVIPSTLSQPEKPWNGCELQNQWAPGLVGASASAQIDQSSAMPISTPVPHGVGSTLWDIQTPPGIPKTVNSDKLVNNKEFQLQQKQVPGWANVQSQTSQKVPISIQYEPHRFGQGMGTPVWGFQSNTVGPQTLLSAAQLKPGNGQELQQQPMVTGTQIIINQPSPFFSPPLAPIPPPLPLPGPHPLHSVAVGALPRPPHPNIFFTPQAVMSERPHMPQTLSLPQLAPRTEPHKLGPRLPFAPERLLQCMICGCSVSRELDLQMHYLQHAQGEI